MMMYLAMLVVGFVGGVVASGYMKELYDTARAKVADVIKPKE